MPGVNLLSAQERELCAVSRLLPVHYLAMKDMMLREADKQGSITRTKARTFFRLDPARSLKMYDLWVSCGWVSGPRAAAARAAAASDTATASEADP
ncbi:Homeodomain-like protein [Haematococcus lacustris]